MFPPRKITHSPNENQTYQLNISNSLSNYLIPNSVLLYNRWNSTKLKELYLCRPDQHSISRPYTWRCRLFLHSFSNQTAPTYSSTHLPTPTSNQNEQNQEISELHNLDINNSLTDATPVLNLRQIYRQWKMHTV